MKAAALALAALLSASSLSAQQTPGGAPPPGRPVDPHGLDESKAVDALLAALSAHDEKRIAALLPPRFAMPRRWQQCAVEETDRACFLRFLRDTFTSLEGSLALQKMRVERNIVRVNLALSTRSTRDEGTARVLVTDEYIVEEGRILSFIRTPRTEDPQTRAYYATRHQER